MKLKVQAAAEEKEAVSEGEKASTAEGEANETFEGEMDNFQTPLVRCGPSSPFFFRQLTVLDSLDSAEQSRSLGTSPLFHSFWRRFMAFYSLNRICRTSSRSKKREVLAWLAFSAHIITAASLTRQRPACASLQY